VALNISLKPRERLVVNGAVIRNKSSRHSLTVEFLNKVNFMREREIMMPEQAITPLLRVIYWLQITYIDPDQRAQAQSRFLELAQDLHDAVAEPRIRLAVATAVDLMQHGKFGAALKVLRDTLPVERALLNMAASNGSGVMAAIREDDDASTRLDLAVVEDPFESPEPESRP
jgi:flagellar biosynthesis repressor protein FlbT